MAQCVYSLASWKGIASGTEGHSTDISQEDLKVLEVVADHPHATMSGDGDDGITHCSKLGEVQCRGRIKSCPNVSIIYLIRSAEMIAEVLTKRVPQA